MFRTSSTLFVLLALCGSASAIINIQFTPRHVVDQAGMILTGTLARDGGQWEVTRGEAIKGKVEETIKLDLGQCDKDQLAQIQAMLEERVGGPVVLITSRRVASGTLHVGGTWLNVTSAGKGVYQVTGNAPQMAGTFAGGTAMLARMLKYLAEHPDASVPVTAGVKWAEDVEVGKVPGATALSVIEWPSAGKPALFVASREGDRLFVPKEKENALVDVTKETGLASKSALVVVVDLDGDGVGDLVGYDGSAINVYFAGKPFKPGGAKWTFKIAHCIGLSPCSNDGRPGVLVSTKSVPVLLAATADGWKDTILPRFAGEVGKVSPCIVADLDNDGFVDILQPGETGGILWKGAKDGFARPVKSTVCTGGGVAIHALGDFHENGLLDIFLSGPQKNTLWANDGKGGFADVFRSGGSLSYKCAPGAAAIAAMDLNHDGRPDLCLSYASGEFQYHFNRGFGCMGEEREVRLTGAERTPLRAFAAADFNGDGSLDLAILQTDGTIRVYFNDRIDQPALMLRLPKGVNGPVTVSCWTDEKSSTVSGVALVSGHTPGAYLPIRDKGNFVLKYRFPNHAPATVKVLVPEGMREVILDPRAGAR